MPTPQNTEEWGVPDQRYQDVFCQMFPGICGQGLGTPPLPSGPSGIGGGGTPGYSRPFPVFNPTPWINSLGIPPIPPSASVNGGSSMPGTDIDTYIRQLLGQGLTNGFPQYTGQLSAGMIQPQMDILNSFFGPGGGYETALGSLSDMGQQDSLGRAQMLLQPSTDRAIQEFTRRTRERMNLGNNLLSTGGAEAESRGVADIYGRQGAELAQLMPALDSIRMQAINGIPQLAGMGFNMGEQVRGIQQQGLDNAYREWLRTTPSGTPLTAASGFLTGTFAPPLPNTPSDRGPTGAQSALNFLAPFVQNFNWQDWINRSSGGGWYLGNQSGPG